MDFQNLPSDVKQHIFNFNRVENNKEFLANTQKFNEVLNEIKEDRETFLEMKDGDDEDYSEDGATFIDWILLVLDGY
jgi:CCR4-NOT transcriptional regulation complex NOT5 subunit